MNQIIQTKRFWTTAELVRLTEAGLLTAEDRFELVRGETVVRSPVGRRHEVVAEKIEVALRLKAPADVSVSTERQFNLDEKTYTKPDVLVRPTSVVAYDLRGPDALLVVEVAATSLDYDLKTKAPLYAEFGVREYWVVNAATLATTIHREPGPNGYASVIEHKAGDLLMPHLVPALAVRLADLNVV